MFPRRTPIRCVPCQPRSSLFSTKQTNKSMNYTGFHKLTILGSSIYETSAGLQQNLESEIELYWVPQINDQATVKLKEVGTPSHSEIQIARKFQATAKLKELGTPSHSEIKRARNSKPQRNTNSSENPSHGEIKRARNSRRTPTGLKMK